MAELLIFMASINLIELYLTCDTYKQNSLIWIDLRWTFVENKDRLNKTRFTCYFIAFKIYFNTLDCALQVKT